MSKIHWQPALVSKLQMPARILDGRSKCWTNWSYLKAKQAFPNKRLTWNLRICTPLEKQNHLPDHHFQILCSSSGVPIHRPMKTENPPHGAANRKPGDQKSPSVVSAIGCTHVECKLRPSNANSCLEFKTHRTNPSRRKVMKHELQVGI